MIGPSSKGGFSVSKNPLDNHECRSCEFYRWIAQICVLDLDAIHEQGLTCTEWEPIRIARKGNRAQASNN